MTLRILSVVTLFSPDGTYGGPTRVALHHASALRAAGHDVELVGGAAGFAELPTHVDGQRVRLFPVRRVVPGTGFAGLSSPNLQRWLRSAVRSADVVHIHLARDLVTLPAARLAQRAGVRYVLQTHGMIDPSSHPLARPLDARWTRPVLRDAAAVLHLTDRERDDVLAVAGVDLPLVPLVNAVPIPPAVDPALPREVLYLARLAPRKRPGMFVEAAQRLARRFPDARFTLVGPDEGEGSHVRALLDRDDADGRIAWVGPLPLDEAATRAAAASVSVLPSVDEPFPMSVIEAMAAGVPVVVTDTCGLAGRIRRHGAGVVVGPSLDELTTGVARLLDSPDEARAAGLAGRELCRAELSMDAVRDELERVYVGEVGASPAARSSA